MAAADRQSFDDALDWVRRIHDPSFDDWAAHAAWLEADPSRLDAFDAASLAIAEATADLASPEPLSAASRPINDNLPAPAAVPDVLPGIARPRPARRRARWGLGIGMAVAAGVAAIVLPSTMKDGARPYLVRTGAGERRSITIDGTTVALNGDSVVRLDHANSRVAVLERGEAFFAVRHDAAHPFSVRAGGATFQDVGTAFDVVQRPGLTQVSVREGAVLYDPGHAGVRLDAGQSLRIAGDTATVQSIGPAAAGSWRSGELIYHDALLTDVAQDIARTIGEPIEVNPTLAQRRFSGVVMVDRNRPLMFRRMAAAMGVDIRQAAQGWRMTMPIR